MWKGQEHSLFFVWSPLLWAHCGRDHRLKEDMIMFGPVRIRVLK